jgi:protein-arginine kinase activator protein McsA
LEGEDEDYDKPGTELETVGEDGSGGENLSRMNVNDLNGYLEQMLQDENYEEAARIRDELQKRGGS